jgi:aquaporin Z
MHLSIDQPLILSVGLGVVALNVACLVVLILLRPGAHLRLRDAGVSGGLCRGLLTEALGTFAVVLVGVLAVVGPAAGGERAPLLQVAVAHGLTVAVCLAGLGRFSGGQFNPAVTLGLLCCGRLHALVGLGYIAAQLAGAVGAAGLLAGLLGPGALAAAVPGPAGEVPQRSAFVLEAAATFVLVLVYFGAAVDARGPKAFAPAAVGAAVTAGVLAIGPLTGAALNPARFLAPAVACGRPDDWLVYTAGPLAGAAVAAVLMHFFLLDEPAAAPAEEPEAEEQERQQAA